MVAGHLVSRTQHRENSESDDGSDQKYYALVEGHLFLGRRRRDQAQRAEIIARGQSPRPYVRTLIGAAAQRARGPWLLWSSNDRLSPRTRLREHVHGENTNRTSRRACPGHSAAPPRLSLRTRSLSSPT